MSFLDSLDALVSEGAIVWGFLLAAVIVLALTPLVIRLALKIGAVDAGGDRPRVHTGPIPRIGGLAIVAGILVAALVFIDIDGPIEGIVIGIPLIAAVGLWDDIRGMRPLVKLILILAICLIPVVGYGIRVEQIGLPVVGIIEFGWLSYPITILWIALVANLVNLIDGVDGLAAGLVAIATLAFAILAVSFERVEVAAMAAIVCGSSLAFLRYNFNPARTFMGDTGALVLGFTVGALAVEGVLKGAATIALAAPLLVLAVPILDTSFVVLKRLRYGRSPFGADQNHFYHRFLRIGFSQRRLVLWLYGWTALMCSYALLLRFVPPRPGGEWDTSNAIVCAIAGVAVIAASIWVIYTLEILKARHLQAFRVSRPGSSSLPASPPADQEAESAEPRSTPAGTPGTGAG
ncbi:MAG: undecaprenyl/decaprenyl-phosphate alpha-N-acetylglucosaminyl 1-phosphate transferase [Solirubrobacteraceae bacterium]|nr:undecaprenyl/decaprenyl-phosphate alpha-N-acetylglucosaminyl 1-phosphate transferase [Solirubrobacteraceae bacterium]